MKKKLIIFIILTSIILSLFSFNVFAKDELSVYIDNKKIEFDVPPQIIDGRTMVPMRKIFEELGAVVGWFGDRQEIWANKGANVICMTINHNALYKNTEEIGLDVAPCIVSGRTLVPVRAVSDSLGANVEWDANTRTVYITNTTFPCAACNGFGQTPTACASCNSRTVTYINNLQAFKNEIINQNLSCNDMMMIYNTLRKSGERILCNQCWNYSFCRVCHGTGEIRNY